MKKIRIQEAIVVEGKYDAATLAEYVDGLIICVNGFSVFRAKEMKHLLVEMGKQRGLVILTDSDAAGFRIRAYLNQLAQGLCVKNAYVPAIIGKEARKVHPSKEGLLGVEGMTKELLLNALLRAGVHERPERSAEQPAITYTDLFELGLSGTQGSMQLRRALLEALGIPPRISKKAMLEVLNSIYSRQEFFQIAENYHAKTKK